MYPRYVYCSSYNQFGFFRENENNKRKKNFMGYVQLFKSVTIFNSTTST